ncbi:hypothetical protein KAFR_0J02120 [Kazachstania africana CBS 2517]|uniref:Major facilitator superfamily (MFS) profile domain-containing protein n=1 Tax=Kazachstania africana (strain ATCC 22294 / BCRC 22015 / CBS 2517 / CECT 1963 / NBRC 1671 / NRRL Y-8276) TaxID=1071382 RepID=H2B0X6_KAZAF|nr:hypothetical protein KAFR_0J02120 [Kazachstania africana CBS 2517]CCF60276.1 hypothetical protein KAFR_0J02120 [Kazachstania africana CBS 2517]
MVSTVSSITSNSSSSSGTRSIYTEDIDSVVSENNHNDDTLIVINNDNSHVTRIRTNHSMVSKTSSLARTITKTASQLRHALQDDNKQDISNSQNVEDVLRYRFDVGDALRLHSNEEQGTSEIAVGDARQLRHTKEEGQSESDLENLSTHDDKEIGETITKVFTNKSTGQVELPPDKGYAWVIVFATWLMMFNTWGCNSAFGVFLAHFLSTDSYPGATKYDYALIAGLTVGIGQGFSPIAVLLSRIFGMKQVMFIGSILYLAANILASFTTKLWQLYVTQGFLVGLSIALNFAPGNTLLAGWFLKKRAVALGISFFGTGAGGVVFGLASNKMIQDDGNARRCYRMLAIVTTVCLWISIALVKHPKPVKPTGIRSMKAVKREFSILFSWKIMTSATVLLIATWFMLAILGYNIMVFTMAAYAESRGMTAHQGSSLTAILNGAQSIGRPLMGLMGDRYGRANITITLTCVLTIYMFAFWIPAHTYVQLIFFNILVGLCIGVANVMNTALIADMVEPEDFLGSWSFVNFFGGPFLLVAELIAQALTDAKLKNNPYLHAQIFTGCCFFSALLLIMVLRERAVRKKLAARQIENDKHLRDFEEDNKENIDDDDADDDDTDLDVLKERKVKYDYILGTGKKKYFARMAYPIKV